MLKRHLAAGFAATLLMTAAAVAHTSPAPTPNQPAPRRGGAGARGQLITQMPPELIRGSNLMGMDVYGSDNQKIGDIDEVIVDRQGKIHAVVVGVGGFLGIGEKDVAIPFDQVRWMTNQEVQQQAGGAGGGTAGGTGAGTTATTGAGPGTTATTGGAGGAGGTTTATGTTGGAGGGAGAGGDPNAPARATVRMTRADLQNAPQFRYRGDAGGAGGAGSGTGGAGGGAGGTAPRQ